MTLQSHIAYLRALAVIDPQTTMLEVALIGALEELAKTVDKLTNDDNQPRGLGSI